MRSGSFYPCFRIDKEGFAKMNTVSVIIPCYNGEKYIDRSIGSVWDQDWAKIELIVVNDGSTDESETKILRWQERFLEKGWKFEYVHHRESCGVGAAVDKALKYVTGEYLTLLDADDLFLQGSVARRAEFLDSHPDHVGVRTNGWMTKEDSRKLFIIDQKEKDITDLFSALIFGQTNNWSGTYMVRTDVLFGFYENRSIYPSKFGQHMQILLPVSYGRMFGYIDEPLMVYVIHNNSHSQADSDENQFQKEENNQQGYRDIYIHVMDRVLKDPMEHKKYRDAFDASYYRCGMLRAIKYGKAQLVRERYRLLVSTGYATLNDRILGSIKSPTVLLLKAVRKIRSFIDG